MASPIRCSIFVAAVLACLVPGAAPAQEPRDPIGPLTKVSEFDHAQRVNVGRMKSGRMACYFREEGSSHSLDIGVTGEGAFIRLGTFDSREATPAPPLRVFAGKRITRRVGDNEFDTGEYQVIQAYDGKAEYYIPDRESRNFVLIAKENANAFLQMVARARTEFVVVQSVDDAKAIDIVAIYKFRSAAIPVLLLCAKQYV